MAQDLFNNISNDYVNPDLAPCPGASDSATFEFLPGQQAGIVSGSAVIAAMNLGDISQPVEGWVQQTKLLQPGEVTFIQGLTKGITYRTQNFIINDDLFTHNQWYMSIDLSINYYKNFRYYSDSIKVTSDYVNGVSIDNALDIAFGDKGIQITTTYVDASALIFTGTQEGYYFDITKIDSCTFLPDTSVYTETLVENPDGDLPAYKYPNTAMLGYVLKVTYPTTAGEADRFVEINHVPDVLKDFEAIDVSQFISPAVWEPSTYYAPTGTPIDVSVLISQVVVESSIYYTDASLLNPIDVSVYLSAEVVSNITYYDAGTQLVDVSVYTAPSSYIDVSLYNDYDVSVNVQEFVSDASYSIQQYWIGSGAAVDVSVFITPCIWEPSTYYIFTEKAVDVGQSGISCNPDTISAADYLDYVQTYEKWEKVGALRIWLTAPDPESSLIENLITGFYVFNPHEFPVKLDYMTIL